MIGAFSIFRVAHCMYKVCILIHANFEPMVLIAFLAVIEIDLDTGNLTRPGHCNRLVSM